MERLYKSFELKEGENGVVEGYASTWTKTPDSYGDIVIKGAFADTLKKRQAIPSLFASIMILIRSSEQYLRLMRMITD